MTTSTAAPREGVEHVRWPAKPLDLETVPREQEAGHPPETRVGAGHDDAERSQRSNVLDVHSRLFHGLRDGPWTSGLQDALAER